MVDPQLKQDAIPGSRVCKARATLALGIAVMVCLFAVGFGNPARAEARSCEPSLRPPSQATLDKLKSHRERTARHVEVQNLRIAREPARVDTAKRAAALKEQRRQEREAKRQRAAEEREAKKQRAAEAKERKREAAEQQSSAPLLCCDGSASPSCTCDRDSYRGCCSHHGGVCGCSTD